MRVEPQARTSANQNKIENPLSIFRSLTSHRPTKFMAWSSRQNTLLALSKPKPPPLPKPYVSIRKKALEALKQAEYKIYKDLACPCCTGKFHPSKVGEEVGMMKLKKMLQEKAVFWCKRCLDFCPTTLRKRQSNKRFCQSCNSLLFEGDLTPWIRIFGD